MEPDSVALVLHDAIHRNKRSSTSGEKNAADVIRQLVANSIKLAQMEEVSKGQAHIVVSSILGNSITDVGNILEMADEIKKEWTELEMHRDYLTDKNGALKKNLEEKDAEIARLQKEISNKNAAIKPEEGGNQDEQIIEFKQAIQRMQASGI
jgi:hypothetical protein